MADEDEKGEESSGLRDTIEKYKGKAKRLVANDGVSKSEREVFESQQEVFKSEKEAFESKKEAFEFQKVTFDIDKRIFFADKEMFNLEKMLFMLEKGALIEKERDKEIDNESPRREEETRERVVEGREVVFNDSEKKFLDFTRGVMYYRMDLSKERIRVEMRDIEKVMASCSGLYRSIHLYSQLDEEKHLDMYMTEAELELPPSDEELYG